MVLFLDPVAWVVKYVLIKHISLSTCSHYPKIAANYVILDYISHEVHSHFTSSSKLAKVKEKKKKSSLKDSEQNCIQVTL